MIVGHQQVCPPMAPGFGFFRNRSRYRTCPARKRWGMSTSGQRPASSIVRAPKRVLTLSLAKRIVPALSTMSIASGASSHLPARHDTNHFRGEQVHTAARRAHQYSQSKLRKTPIACAACPDIGAYPERHNGVAMSNFVCMTERSLRDSDGGRTLRVLPMRDLKAKTWYFGARCICQRLLALCEDCFSGKGTEDLLPVPIPLAVECECGAVITAQVLHKFRTP